MKTQNEHNRITNGNTVRKTVQALLLAIAITFTSVLPANSSLKDVEKNTITTDVAELLENPSFILKKDTLAYVTLAVNKNNQLVVLFVESENEEIVSYIKGRLNYTKISVELADKSKTYIIPVRLKVEY